MMTRRSAKKQLKAFRKMTTDRFADVSANEKMAGAAILGVAIGVASTLCRPLFQSSTVPPKSGRNKSA